MEVSAESPLIEKMHCPALSSTYVHSIEVSSPKETPHLCAQCLSCRRSRKPSKKGIYTCKLVRLTDYGTLHTPEISDGICSDYDQKLKIAEKVSRLALGFLPKRLLTNFLPRS